MPARSRLKLSTISAASVSRNAKDVAGPARLSDANARPIQLNVQTLGQASGQAFPCHRETKRSCFVRMAAVRVLPFLYLLCFRAQHSERSGCRSPVRSPESAETCAHTEFFGIAGEDSCDEGRDEPVVNLRSQTAGERNARRIRLRSTFDRTNGSPKARRIPPTVSGPKGTRRSRH